MFIVNCKWKWCKQVVGRHNDIYNKQKLQHEVTVFIVWQWSKWKPRVKNENVLLQFTSTLFWKWMSTTFKLCKFCMRMSSLLWSICTWVEAVWIYRTKPSGWVWYLHQLERIDLVNKCNHSLNIKHIWTWCLSTEQNGPNKVFGRIPKSKWSWILLRNQLKGDCKSPSVTAYMNDVCVCNMKLS